MKNIKLLYFEGCPNVQKIRNQLVALGHSFEEVKQDLLPKEHPLRLYSSPSILHNELVVYGTATTSGACTLENLSTQIRDLLPSPRGQRKIHGAQVLSQTGSWGSILTVVLCPVCKPALAALLASAGVGFLAKEEFLKPLLILFLIVTVVGFFWSYLKQHKNIVPALLGIVFAIGLYFGRYVYFGAVENSALTWVSVTGLIGTGIWNLFLQRKRKIEGPCQGACAQRSLS